MPKKIKAKEFLNHNPITLISHASNIVLKILQARLQQYVNQEFPDIQAGFRKGTRTRDQIANTCGIMGKAREFQKSIYFFIDYAKAFDSLNHSKIINRVGVPDQLICLLRKLYVDQEATVRTGHRTTDWFKIGEGV